jgi:Niemann-Pick C1 protein
MVSNSDLYNYFTYEKKYIEIGPPAYLVLTGFDYNNASDLAIVQILSNQLA